jgi:hypothetical protein
VARHGVGWTAKQIPRTGSQGLATPPNPQIRRTTDWRRCPPHPQEKLHGPQKIERKRTTLHPSSACSDQAPLRTIPALNSLSCNDAAFDSRIAIVPIAIIPAITPPYFNHPKSIIDIAILMNQTGPDCNRVARQSRKVPIFH